MRAKHIHIPSQQLRNRRILAPRLPSVQRIIVPPVADQLSPTLRQNSPALVVRLEAQRIEDHVRAADGIHGHDPVLVRVNERMRTCAAHRSVIVLGRRAVDLCALLLAQREQRVAHRPAESVDEDALALLHASTAEHHPVGGGPVEDQRDGLLQVDALRNGDEVLFRQVNALGLAFVDAEAAYEASGGEFGALGADLLDGSDAAVPRGERGGALVGVASQAHGDV